MIPTIIVLFGAGYSWVVLDDIEAKASDRMPLNVIGQQFKWTFQYPEEMVGSGDTATPVTTNELHVPVDRQLEITMSALDVLHSFWVPEWGIKRDAVPAGDPEEEGIDNEFVVTPDEEGTFSLVCTELCGTGHATMRAHGGRGVAGGVRSVARRAGRGAGSGRGRRFVGLGRGIGFEVGQGVAAALKKPGLGRGATRLPARKRIRLRAGRCAARDLRASRSSRRSRPATRT